MELLDAYGQAPSRAGEIDYTNLAPEIERIANVMLALERAIDAAGLRDAGASKCLRRKVGGIREQLPPTQ